VSLAIDLVAGLNLVIFTDDVSGFFQPGHQLVEGRDGLANSAVIEQLAQGLAASLWQAGPVDVAKHEVLQMRQFRQGSSLLHCDHSFADEI